MKAGGNKAARVTLAGLVVDEPGTPALWPWHETTVREGIVRWTDPSGVERHHRISLLQNDCAHKLRARAIRRALQEGSFTFQERQRDVTGWKFACFMSVLALAMLGFVTRLILPGLATYAKGQSGLDIAIVIAGVLTLIVVAAVCALVIRMAWLPLRINTAACTWSHDQLTWTDTLGATHTVRIADITAWQPVAMSTMHVLRLRTGEQLTSGSSIHDRRRVLAALRPDLLPPTPDSSRDALFRLARTWFIGSVSAAAIGAAVAHLAGALTWHFARAIVVMMMILPLHMLLAMFLHRVQRWRPKAAKRRRSSSAQAVM